MPQAVKMVVTGPFSSGKTQFIQTISEIEVVATTGTLLDALLVDIAAAIAGDRTLSGAVEWTQPGAPSFDDAETEGAAAARAASVPVTLSFTVAGSPLA